MGILGLSVFDSVIVVEEFAEKVIQLLGKCVTKTSQQEKRAHGDYP